MYSSLHHCAARTNQYQSSQEIRSLAKKPLTSLRARNMKNPQKSWILKLGFVAVLLGLSGLFTYLVVQVPQLRLRAFYGDYRLESDYLNSVAYQ